MTFIYPCLKFEGFLAKHIAIGIGLDGTGHTSFPTGQDQTPKFAGQVLPNRTESGLIFSNMLPAYQVQIINFHKIRSLDTILVSKVAKPNK